MEISPTLFAILLILLGFVFVVIILLTSRLIPRPLVVSQTTVLPPPPAPNLNLDAHQDAVLVIKTGAGRIEYLNKAARELFEVWEEEPNLERLARRARPRDTFLSLCGGEGQARIALNGRFVDAISYFTRHGSDGLMIVSFHRPQLVGVQSALQDASQTGPGGDYRTSQALAIFSELSQAIASSLDLTSTLSAILEGIERLLPSDFSEITIWQPGHTGEGDHGYLIPYRLVGSPGLDRRLERSNERYITSEGYSGHLFSTRSPLLVNNVSAYREASPALDRRRYPFQSYLGVPLSVAGTLVGTLELASYNQNSYAREDLELLQVIAGQAAIAVNNALLYQEEQQRALELAGLANLAQAVSATGDTHDLFARLVETIIPLVNVEIIGFLVYHETQRVLKGQIPFYGIQPDIIDWYQAPIPADSQAEKLLQSNEMIVVTEGPDDPRLVTLELHHLAQMAGIRQAVLSPLHIAGKTVGFLLLANKRIPTPFDQDDLRLVAIISGQAAPIIENANLVVLAQRRAQRAETLRRIASLTSSNATLDEIFKFSILDLCRLLQADIAVIFLVDEHLGELRAHQGSMFGIAPDIANSLGRISLDNSLFPRTVTGSKQVFFSGDLGENSYVMPLYWPFVEKLGMRSAIDVPLIVRDRTLGELMLGSLKPNFFQSNDTLSVTSIAGQLASVIEQATLASQTDQDLRLRVDQMTALTHISRELNTTVDLGYLLQRVYDEAMRTSRADCGSILLLDLQEDPSKWSADNPPKVNLQLGDPGDGALHPLELFVIQHGESLIIDDFMLLEQGLVPGESNLNRGLAHYPPESFPIHSPHAGIRSGLLVPIAYQGQVAGLFHLHAHDPGVFHAPLREIVESLAVQTAIALGNAQRYREQVQRSELLNRRLETLSRLIETSKVMQAERPLSEALEDIAYALQAATPFEIVLISVYDPQTRQLQRVAGAGIPLVTMQELKQHHQPFSSVQELMQSEFQLGQCYFIPEERGVVVPADVHTVTLLTGDEQAATADFWRPDDILMIPLYSSHGEPLGLISVDAPRNKRRPDKPTLDSLEIFGSQAALAIEVQDRIESYRERLHEVQEIQRKTQEAASAAKESLPLLLHKDLEQTLAIHNLTARATRIHAGLEIASLVNQQNDRSAIFTVLSNELLQQMDFDVALVAEPVGGGLHLVQTAGSLPAHVNLEALLGQRNPLRHVLSTGDTLLVADLTEGSGWQNIPLLNVLEAKSFICLPINRDASASAASAVSTALLCASSQVAAPYHEDDLQLFILLTRQVSVALNNLQLFEDTRQRLQEVNLLLDFNRQMGSLDPAAVLRSLAESALRLAPNARQAMVAMWDNAARGLVPQVGIGYTNPDRLKEVIYQPGEGLPGQVYATLQTVRLPEVDFAQHYNLSTDNMLRFRDATGGQLPVSSLAIPLLASSAEITPLGVLVLSNPNMTGAFNAGEQALITSLAQQTALILENARLYQASEQRARQLQALTAASMALSASLKAEDLVATLLDQLIGILPYDTGTLWLRQEPDSRQMIVRQARGFADSDQRVGLLVEIEDSQLLNEMISSGQPIYVPDVRMDERFPALMEFERLSWLGLPLITSSGVSGVIALEKTEAEFFRPEDIQLAMTFSSQAAVSLENATLYQESVGRTAELDQRSKLLARLNRLSTELSGSLEVQHILDFSLQQLFEVIHCTSVSAILITKNDSGQSEAVLSAEYPRLSPDINVPLPGITLFERLQETLGAFNSEDIQNEPELVPLETFLASHNTRALLALTMATGNTLHGILLAHNDRPYRFEIGEVELARTIGNQVAIALQNARLFAETISLTSDLEQRVRLRTAEMENQRRRAETLLRIITELSASLDLDQVLNRTLHALNEVVDAQQITILIARPGERKLHRLASVGKSSLMPSQGLPSNLDVNQGLAGWVISNRSSTLVGDLSEDSRWVDITYPDTMPSMNLPAYRSAIAVPLTSGVDAFGAIMFLHHTRDHFSEELLDLVQAAANQVAVAVNNAELYRLIRDQAEDLGGMLRTQQIETSRSKAILEAVADGVLVTDSNRKIMLFNASAEKILQIERERVLGKSLEHFTGLFGRATRNWLDTINAWSQNPLTSVGEMYAEQINLENGRVIAIRLAVVMLQSSFLGTVSILQDITHQAELDRLKSEFVATVSHELRTPMTSIKGYVDVLLMGAAGPINEQQNNFLKVIQSNTERLAILVNDLLDISRFESGRVLLSLQSLDLTKIGDEALKTLERRAREDNKPIVIQKKLPANLPPVYGDPERVRQILDNLLDNAYHYNTANGKITLRMRQVGDEIQIDVKDTGLGIPPSDQAHIFERFFRGENPLILGVSGTGLGLSIVQNLVEMHHGRIWVESKGVPGEGSTFSFTLPMYQQGQDPRKSD